MNIPCSPEKYCQRKISEIIKLVFPELLVDEQVPEDAMKFSRLPMVSVRESEIQLKDEFSYITDKYEFRTEVVIYMSKGKTKNKAEDGREEARVLVEEISEAVRSGWKSDHSLICFQHFYSSNHVIEALNDTVLAAGLVIICGGIHTRANPFYIQGEAPWQES